MYLKMSPYMKEDGYESEITLRIKQGAAGGDHEKDLIDILDSLEDIRKTPEYSVKRLLIFLTLLSFGIVYSLAT